MGTWKRLIAVGGEEEGGEWWKEWEAVAKNIYE